MEFPPHKKLNHARPPWLSGGDIFFITINCAARGKNTLAKPEIAEPLFDGMKVYQEQQKWWIHLALLMPDHLHMLASFSPRVVMAKTVADWKRYQAGHLKIDWQDNFFDHRIRSQELLLEKYKYIRMNPVRWELVAEPADWPYVWPK